MGLGLGVFLFVWVGVFLVGCFFVCLRFFCKSTIRNALKLLLSQATPVVILGCGISALTLSDLKWVWRVKNKRRHHEVLKKSILERFIPE